ncbi:MAG: hypothetical protein ACOC1G_09075 [Phycisphaeraceae bacterium]
MESLFPLLTFLALAAIVFVVVTMVCYTLASDLKHQIDRHELIREARLQRADYLAQLLRRMNGESASESGATTATPAIVGEIEPSPLHPENAQSNDEPDLAAAA